MLVVLDTNVIVSALCSATGASFALIHALPSPKFTPVLSQSLWTEYQDAAYRYSVIPTSVSQSTRETICRIVFANAQLHQIHYLWRTQLPDPGDAHVLEVAIAGRVDYIVTHNIKNFGPARSFGITAITPGQFIRLIGGVP